MAEFAAVGKSVPRVDALEKVTGKAQFSINFQLPHMLYGKIVRSPYPHARIVSIDASKAEKLPGVRAVVTAMNAPAIKLAGILVDRYAFPPDLVVRYVGDAVAAVAAETEDIAEEAASMIEVEYQELPAVFDVEEAFEKDPPAIVHPDMPNYEVDRTLLRHRPEAERPNVSHHFQIRQGDVEKGFEQADLIVENRYFTPRLHHNQMETCVCVAWTAADGTLTLRTSAQGAWATKTAICEAFQLSPRKVRVECPYIGGGFGGKGRTLAEPYAILLSMKARGAPVRIAFTREEHFHSGRSRVPVVTYIKDGFKKDGTLVARQLTVLVDTGAYAEMAVRIVRYCTFGAVGTYRSASFKLDSYGVYTNTPMSGPFRGFGSAEVQWGVENQMDIAADKLGIDPVEIRRKNILKEGDRDSCGQVTHSTAIAECLDRVQKWIGWGSKPPIEKGPWKIGKGIALGNKYTTPGRIDSTLVKVHPDGSLEVRHSSHEIGMGVNTVAAQIVAESFGIPVDQVRVVSGDTDVCPYGAPPVSSHTTFCLGNALLAACADAKRQLSELVAPRLGVRVELLETRNGKICVKGHPGQEIAIRDLFRPAGMGITLTRPEIIGQCSFDIPGIPEDPETGQSERMVTYYCYGAQAVEVAVNVKTGKIKILRSAACFDAGFPINPQLCEGQIEGGMVMGLGSALYEEMVMDKGVVLNPSFLDCKVLTAEDLPGNTNFKAMVIGAPHREGPFGAKGLGEAVMIPAAPALSNAVYNAVGVRINELPISSEKVLKVLKEKAATRVSA